MLQAMPFVQEVIINSAQGNSLNLVVTPQSEALITIQQALKPPTCPPSGFRSRAPASMMSTSPPPAKPLMDAEMAAASSRDIKAERKQNMR